MDDASGGVAVLDHDGEQPAQAEQQDIGCCQHLGFPVVTDVLPPGDPPEPFLVGGGAMPDPPRVRWMIRADMPEVVAIERRSFEFPWTEEDFTRQLRQRNCIGMVAALDDKIVGYMIYELHKTRLHILNIAVHPDHRRDGVGTVLIDKLKGKLKTQPNGMKRCRLLLEVRETNLDAQLWLRSLGFRAVSILRSFYDDTPEDAYVMQYRVRELEPA